MCIRDRGKVLPALKYSLQVSVVRVSPGGTGRPMLVISARLAPLPPNKKMCIRDRETVASQIIQ